MIKKLRRKFIAVIMSVVTLLVSAAFIGILISTSATLDRDSDDALAAALSSVGAPETAPFDQHGGGFGHLPFASPFDSRRIPTLLAETSSDGKLLKYTNKIFSISDSAVADITQQALTGGKDSGFLQEYNLKYLIQRAPDGSARVAFLDISMQSRMFANLLQNAALIIFPLLLAFFLISILIARWIVRPVEKAWNSQNQFVADASHELKTPLTVILSNTAMLSSLAPPDDEKTSARLNNLSAEARRMKTLVDDLLSLARSEASGIGGAAMQTIDFSVETQAAVLNFEPVIFDLGKTFEYTIEEGLTVQGDATKLRQLVDILLDNACKYSLPAGRITARLKKHGKSELLLEVSNDSVPIGKEELSRIFERFYRLDKSRSGDGSGLGLAIAERFVRLHGGRIWAHSDNGRTTFYILMPLAR